MSVSTTHVENTFTGNGVTTAFVFTFQVLDATHIESLVNSVTIATNLYTVAVNQDQEATPGGTVTFNTAPGNGLAVKLQRVTPLTQEVGFSLEAKLNTTAVEQVFDKLTMLMQEAKARTQGPAGPTGATGATGAAGNLTGSGLSNNGALIKATGSGTVGQGPLPTNEGDIVKVVGGVWAAASAAASIPSGTCALWPFDPAVVAIPTGWAHCNGQTVTINGVSRVTPDTRGKYVLGASTDDTGSSGYTGSTVRPGTISGTKTHDHANGGGADVSIAALSGTVTTTSFGAAAGAFGLAVSGTYSLSIANHNHTATLTGSTQASTESARPIEAALLVIIKVD